MQRFICAAEANRTLILETERYIWSHPETGYKEIKTSAYMEEKFTELGYELIKPDGITGFCTVFDTGRPGPELLILGELDSVICPTHPEADPVTGAVHACGHNAQCAALLGIAAALKDPTVTEQMCGRIRLCAVPAEELLEIEYRKQLRAEGKIRYFGGKSEFLARGMFDGVDLAFMVHTAEDCLALSGAVGCLAKEVVYKGKASHAGTAPWDGNNALYAATCGLNAVNAIRETFRERDIIRVHPIVTHGGDMVNAIPGTVRLESYVRGSSFEGIAEANDRVNRALTGAALSLGTNIEIIDIPGYAPLINDGTMAETAKEACDTLFPELDFRIHSTPSTGSTDMGDLSCVMPTLHPFWAGATGTAHGSDFVISDPETACVKCAAFQLAFANLLLKDGGARAKEIVAAYKPRFADKEAYLMYMDSLNASGDRIEYRSDGTATVRL